MSAWCLQCDDVIAKLEKRVAELEAEKATLADSVRTLMRVAEEAQEVVASLEADCAEMRQAINRYQHEALLEERADRAHQEWKDKRHGYE